MINNWLSLICTSCIVLNVTPNLSGSNSTREERKRIAEENKYKDYTDVVSLCKSVNPQEQFIRLLSYHPEKDENPHDMKMTKKVMLHGGTGLGTVSPFPTPNTSPEKPKSTSVSGGDLSTGRTVARNLFPEYKQEEETQEPDFIHNVGLSVKYKERLRAHIVERIEKSAACQTLNTDENDWYDLWLAHTIRLKVRIFKAEVDPASKKMPQLFGRLKEELISLACDLKSHIHHIYIGGSLGSSLGFLSLRGKYPTLKSIEEQLPTRTFRFRFAYQNALDQEIGNRTQNIKD